MAQVINTNIMSLMAQQNLNKSQNALSNSIRRLSTGYRINSAKDDAAGQGIANRFTSQIRGLTQAARNTNDGISLAQTMESGLNRINDNLQRIRELIVQGLNAINSSSDKYSIHEEMEKHNAEIERIIKQVTFNNIKVLDQSGYRNFQVGANDEDIVAFEMPHIYLMPLDVNNIIFDFQQTIGGGESNTDLHLLRRIDEIINTLDNSRGIVGKNLNRFESIVTELNDRINNLSASRSRIEDADYATEISNMTRAQILQQASTAALAQANQAPQTVLSLLQQLMQ